MRVRGLKGKRWAALFVTLCVASAALGGYVWYLCAVDSGLLRVAFLDVGQGDSASVTLPGGGTLLIDGGDEGSWEQVLLPYFRARGIYRLEAVYLSHYHSDHMMGILELLEARFPVKRLCLLPEELDSSELGTQLRQAAAGNGTELYSVSPGEKTDFEDVELQNLTPVLETAGDSDSMENNRSMVLRLSYGESSFLFTGDIEREAEAALCGSPELRADILKLAHHGSKTSSSPEFLQAVRPRYAVAGVKSENQYRLPAEQTLFRLQREGIGLLRTDLDGTVEVTASRTGIQRIETSRHR